jgi:hypothetical protein
MHCPKQERIDRLTGVEAAYSDDGDVLQSWQSETAVWDTLAYDGITHADDSVTQ